MESLNFLLDTLLIRLAWTSAQAVLLIGAVWLIGRLLPRLPAALRCTLWWLVGLQLILGLCWSSPLQLRVLTTPPPIAAVVHDHAIMPAAAITAGVPMARAVAETPRPTPAAWHAHWRPILVSLWLAAVLMQLLIAGKQWRASRRVLRDSHPSTDDALRAVCAEQVRKLGLRRQPQLRVSAAIRSPQVTGLWRTTVLLPADQRLTLPESAMAMAHELAHLRRGDLWLGWIPAVAQRLFFFHPLVAWAVREYALSREAACDAQVLQQTGTMPQAYGHLLLRLGIAHPMHSGLAGASPSFHNLKRRLIMLQQSENPARSRARAWPLVVLVALAGVLPYRVTASAPQNTPATAPTTLAAPTPPTPPAPPAPPPLPPTAPLPLPPPPPPPPRMHGFSAHHVSIDTSSDAAYGFALLDGDSITVNGSDADVDALNRLRKGNEPILWFRRGNMSYVVRDSAYIQRAKAIYAPVSELGRQQGELGGEQGRLGGEQGGLGARQGSLGMRQGQLAAEQAKLAGAQAALDMDPHNDKRRAEVEAMQSRLQASQDKLARQQDELARQQDALGKQQDALGAKQDALGKRQKQAADEANRQIAALIDEALAKGVAKPTNLR
jgi:beta-lactamase regulating signal transducer with metallopeptidase domain